MTASKFVNPINTPQRRLKTICIGAGASGLYYAYKIQRHFDDFDLTVYEKNAGIAGTWWENRYPGCACDVPAHSYIYSFEPYAEWSSSYASSKEIYGYFKHFADKYDLNKYIKLQHQVSAATWDEESATWSVQIKDLVSGEIITDWCHILVNASGILNAWRYPPIPGLNSFKGKLLHTANWDESEDLTGKTVGLVGNGSSAIQVLPTILPIVSKLTTFIMEPTWVSPPVGMEYKVYSDEDKKRFREHPEELLEMRRETENYLNGQFETFFRDSEHQLRAREFMRAEMTRKLGDPALVEKLIPSWSVGCRRITPGRNYLESLSDPKVEVVFSMVSEVTEKGCKVLSGSEHEMDVLIMATGFDTSFKPRFPVIGRDGKSLAEVWEGNPQAYLGIAASGFPNYFVSLGPNCPIGNGPVLLSIEVEVNYMIDMISRYQKENIKAFDVCADAVKDFNEHKDEFMDTTIWVDECKSWYKAGSSQNKVTALWPGSTLHYREALAVPRYEDWKFTYYGNRFDYLGNGRSVAEAVVHDLNSHVGNEDTSKIDPALKRAEAKKESVQ
ncbi:flavin-binding monooxygenase [Myxozyma melibiosi]|uniref:Flavin-binding monooxygenase n=1 Tax=Myxozyma melibiosi TaxID=54550 RepID=A0ABR1F309_9ASCO